MTLLELFKIPKENNNVLLLIRGYFTVVDVGRERRFFKGIVIGYVFSVRIWLCHSRLIFPLTTSQCFKKGNKANIKGSSADFAANIKRN